MQTRAPVLKKIAVAIAALAVLFGSAIRLELRGPGTFGQAPVPLEKLLSGSLTEQEMYDRLENSAESGAAVTRDLAIALSAHSSALLRQGAARVIGNFTDEFAKVAHERLLGDSAEAIHLEAVRSLGRKPAAWREAYLDSLLTGSLFPTQELFALSALARISSSSAKRAEAVGRIVAFIQNSTDQVFRSTAFLEALGSGGEDPRVIQLCKNLLERGSDVSLMRVAWQHLVKRKEKSALPLLGSLSRSPAAAIREEALSGIHVFCPPDRWSILAQRLEADEDAGVRRAAIREVARLADREGIEFLEQMQNRGFIRAAERPHAEATRKQLSRAVLPACEPGGEAKRP